MEKQKFYFGFIAILLVAVVLISIYFGPFAKARCPTCPNPGTWSECTDEAAKTRSNYKCSAETNYTCESYTEKKACETEIKLKGMGTLEVIISPTLDETVKGIIKVEAVAAPERTEKVMFFFMPQDVQLGGEMTEEEAAKVLQEVDMGMADGWKVFFDTTKVENGLYKIFIGPTYEGASDENPWLDYVQTQVVAKN